MNVHLSSSSSPSLSLSRPIVGDTNYVPKKEIFRMKKEEEEETRALFPNTITAAEKSLSEVIYRKNRRLNLFNS